MEQFTFFYRTDSPFSFWYPSTFTENEVTFSSAQQFILYRKALLFEDAETAAKVMAVHEKKDLMKLGRSVKNFDRTLWDSNRETIAMEANQAKFSQNENLKEALLATEGTTLANANVHDIIWGIGFEEAADEAKDRSLWRGKNLLGELLTKLRGELKPATAE